MFALVEVIISWQHLRSAIVKAMKDLCAGSVKKLGSFLKDKWFFIMEFEILSIFLDTSNKL